MYRLVWCKQTGGGYQICGCVGLWGRERGRRWVQFKETAEEARPGTSVSQGLEVKISYVKNIKPRLFWAWLGHRCLTCRAAGNAIKRLRFYFDL